MKKVFISFSIFNFSLIFSQTSTVVEGKILTTNYVNDTISFVPCLQIDEKYYEKRDLSSKIIDDKFHLNLNLTYPQMYQLNLKSEKNSNKIRLDILFLDKTTSDINFDSEYKLKKSNGLANIEFLKKFMPYITQNQEGKILNFYSFDDRLDTKMYEYIKENKDSYVALWYLIGRFNQEGYKDLYEKCLESFSNEIKESIPWNVLNDEFLKISIKIDSKFPEILLQNEKFEKEILNLPLAGYTLIDFWFSRCRPCLEEMPQWVNLYEKYSLDGLNIIGISTDNNENAKTYWPKRIIELKIPWKNYLDENASFASKEKITSYPTNFLLNSRGEIIRKNITAEELEKLLIDLNLKSNKLNKHFNNYVRKL